MAKRAKLESVSDAELLAAVSDISTRIGGHKDALPDLYAERVAMFKALKERGVMVKDIAAAAGVVPEAVTIALAKANA